MGLLLPAGRAIAWQAQGWSRRGRRSDPALPCSGLRAFLGTLRPRPSTYCYDFFPIVGLLAMLFPVLAQNLCCLSPFLQFSVSAGRRFEPGPGSPHTLGRAHVGDRFVLGAGGSLFSFSRAFQGRFRMNPRTGGFCPFFLLDCALFPRPHHGAFTETRETRLFFRAALSCHGRVRETSRRRLPVSLACILEKGLHEETARFLAWVFRSTRFPWACQAGVGRLPTSAFLPATIFSAGSQI